MLVGIKAIAIYIHFLFIPIILTSSLIDDLRNTISSNDLLKKDFVNWATKYLSSASAQYKIDPHYLNQMKIKTTGFKYRKSSNLDTTAFTNIEKADSVMLVFQQLFKFSVPFPKFLCKLKKVKTMNLRNLAIATSLAKLTELEGLEELALDSCVLQTIDALIPLNSKLKKLTIKNCKILNGEINIAKVPNLEALTITNSTLAMINKEIFMTNKLKKIDFSCNHLIGLPNFDINDDVKTEELILTENYFHVFPSNINMFKKLKKLDLSKNFILRFEKDFIFDKNLVIEDLNLSDNLIESLPDNMENLKKIKSLNLADNRINSVDVSLFRYQSIEKLNLSINEIKEIKETISGFSGAVQKFTSIISGMAPGKLKELDLSYNKLESIPYSFSYFISLEKLNLEGNFCKSVPSAVFYLKNLQSLNMAYNRINQIPTGLGQLLFLYEMNFSGGKAPRLEEPITNTITGVPRILLETRSGRLIKITLKGNKLLKESTLFNIGENDIRRYYPNSIVL